VDLNCSRNKSRCLIQQRSKCLHSFEEDLDPEYDRNDAILLHDPLWIRKPKEEPLLERP
jgi:hypothetical protein